MVMLASPPRPASPLATDLAAAIDPVVFAQRAGIEPDPWQADVLRSVAPRLLLNCSRQSGKSTTTAILAMHTALYAPGSLILLVSPSERQSGELFKKCVAVYRAMDSPVPAHSETALTLTLKNDSRIVSLPGKEGTIRGFSGVDLVIEDEAARADDALYLALRPMLSVSRGRLIRMSAPFGKRGHFFEAWTNGGPDWERFEVRADQVSRIGADFLEQERRALPARWYRQEYECSFEETDDQLFAYEDVLAALSDDVAPLFTVPADSMTITAPGALNGSFA